MARKRMIDPGIWRDRAFGRMSSIARLLWIGLISNADDDGRVSLDPSDLKADIFRYDDLSHKEIAEALDEIERAGLGLMRYVAKGQAYGWLRNWASHQSIQKPYPSRLPAPPDPDTSSEQSDNTTVPLSDSSDTSLVPVSYQYDTDTVPIQYQSRIEEEVKEKRREEKKRTSANAEGACAPAGATGKAGRKSPQPKIPLGPGVLLFLEIFNRRPKSEYGPAFDQVFDRTGEALMRERLTAWRDRDHSQTNYAGMLDVARNGWRQDRGSPAESPPPVAYYQPPPLKKTWADPEVTHEPPA